MNIAEKFGSRLKSIRRAKILTQQDLGIKSGMDSSHISHFEQGTRSPSLENILKLCKGLKCKPGRLLDHLVE